MKQRYLDDDLQVEGGGGGHPVGMLGGRVSSLKIYTYIYTVYYINNYTNYAY